MRVSRSIAAVAIWAAATVLTSTVAHAAGAAYQVDTSEVSEAGSCKVESWVSLADNRDRFAAVTPTCAFEGLRPYELSAQFSRSRSDGEWSTGLAPKLKVNLAPSGIGVFGWAVEATTFFDLTGTQNTGIAVGIPATVRLSDNARINLNAGWFWDRTTDRQYATYGAGLDLRTSDNVWTFTAEVFGQLGAADEASMVQPRFQTGLRYRPVDEFNIDVIYGRNIYGENANWITVATTVRFQAAEK
jgi:hypothetical protein